MPIHTSERSPTIRAKLKAHAPPKPEDPTKEVTVLKTHELSSLKTKAGGKKGDDSPTLSTSSFTATSSSASPSASTKFATHDFDGSLKGKSANGSPSNDRKQRILEIESEKKKKRDDNEQSLKPRPQEGKLDAHHHEKLKEMNAMIELAKISHVRDLQMEEKRNTHEEQRKLELRLDQMMRDDTDRKAAEREEIEALKVEERKNGAQVIRQQIKERELERLRNAEASEKEKAEVLRHLQDLKEKERQDLEAKRRSQKEHNSSLKAANEEMMRAKQRQAELEKEEMSKTKKYLEEVAQREAAQQQEVAEQKAKREKEWARMRALQESTKDMRSERDALRAARESEESERRWRAAEQEQAAVQAQQMGDLKHTLANQIDTKKQKQQEQEEREREEMELKKQDHQRLKKEQRDAAAEDRARKTDYKQTLKMQVADKRASQKREEEQKEAERQEAARLAKVKQERFAEAKAEKIKELQEAGVHDKYVAHVQSAIAKKGKS